MAVPCAICRLRLLHIDYSAKLAGCREVESMFKYLVANGMASIRHCGTYVLTLEQ